MFKALDKLKKLRGRSLDELRTRGAQAAACLAERAGLARAARLPTDAEFRRLLDPRRFAAAAESDTAAALLEHFRARRAPRFFPSFDDPGATAAEWLRRFGEEGRAALVARAERVLGGRFRLLGHEDLSFGDPPDWHLEPVSGRRAPLSHWSRIDYLDPRVAGDKKITWELNRHQHLLTLGRAYLLTRDERYAAEFVSQVESWMDANPPKRGINWASSLEVAFRSIAWLWSLHFFKDSPAVTPPFFLRALKFLHLNARHLETYLSTYFSPNTHLTGEALGLLYLGTLLPELRDAARWRDAGERILLEQLPRHVRPDGTYFEQSSYYLRYTADFYTHLLLLARAEGRRPDPSVPQKLSALLDHLLHVTRPDGTATLYGDDDGGRLLPVDSRPPDDFRAALSTGAAIFSRGDYKHVAGAAAEETLWLLGPEGLRDFDRLEAHAPPAHARAFADGGYFCARDGWTTEAGALLVVCGPHGAPGGAHAHADALSFELAARGRALLVDPGTYTYTASAELRDHFRTTAAHNALVIDGEPSSAPAGPFSWRTAAAARARRWHTAARFAFFEGEHDGYLRLARPAAHARAFLFLCGDYVVMRDRVETEGPHRYELYFHFAPGADPRVEAAGDGRPLDEGDAGRRPASEGGAGRGVSVPSVVERGEPGLSLHTFGAGGRWRTEGGWVSRCYGSRERAAVCVYEAAGEGPQEFFTFLLPRARRESARAREFAAGASESDARDVREVVAEGGRAFEVRSAGARDLLLVKSDVTRGGVVVAGGVDAACESDFEWTWVRVGADGRVAECVLVGGRRLVFGGEEVFAAPGGAGHAAGQRVGGEWLFETDARGSVDARGFSAAGAREEAYVRD